MNFLEEITNLGKQGIYINYSNEYYKNGSNCNFNIEFIENGQMQYATAWFGDNHEFGDVNQAMEASIKMAKWFLIDNNKEKYFQEVKETVTKKGYDAYMEVREANQELFQYLYDNHPPYKKSSDKGEKFMAEYEINNR